MRDDISEAIEEACGTATDTGMWIGDKPVRVDNPKTVGKFLTQLQRLLENLPTDLTLEELREEIDEEMAH